MVDKITYLSPQGLQKLKDELEFLKHVRRRELADRIEAAKALGDLSENAEYHQAKDELSFVEGRIMEIEGLLRNISIIESGASEVVRIGSTIHVQVQGKVRTYAIVGFNEADPANGKISNESPLGNAFLGHRVGEIVEVETPAGLSSFTILSIS